MKSEYFIILFIYSSLILIKHSAFARMSRLLHKYIHFWNWMIPFYYQIKYSLKIELWIYESPVRLHCQMRWLPVHGMSNRSSWGWQWRKPGPSLFFPGKSSRYLSENCFFCQTWTHGVLLCNKPKQTMLWLFQRERCNKLIDFYANTLKQVLQENSLMHCIGR